MQIYIKYLNHSQLISMYIGKYFQVIDTERDVLEKERSITDHLYRRMNMKLKTITVYFLQVILVMLYLFFIMITPSEIRSFCSSMKKTGQEQYLPSLVYLCKLNSDGKIMEKPSLLYLFLFWRLYTMASLRDSSYAWNIMQI